MVKQEQEEPKVQVIDGHCTGCGWYTTTFNAETINRHLQEHERCTPMIPRGETSPNYRGKFGRKRSG